MKSRIFPISLFCLLLCGSALGGEKVFHDVVYRPPADRTQWNKALTALLKDIENLNIRGNPKFTQIEKNMEAMQTIFADNGFKGARGTFIFVLPEMGCIVVHSDKVFHRKLTRGLGLQKMSE